MIQKAWFRNFKAHRQLDLSLEPLTVLVGPNASGKTSVLQGLWLLGQLAKAPAKDVFADEFSIGYLRSAIPSASSDQLKIGVEGIWNGERESFQVAALPPDAPGRPLPIYEPSEFPPHLQALRPALGAVSLLHLDVHKLAAPSISEAGESRISHDGSGLASRLADLKLGFEGVFAKIEGALRRIVPSVERVRVERVTVTRTDHETITVEGQRIAVPKTRSYSAYQVVFDMVGATGIPAHAAGEGTLLALGLLTKIIGPEKTTLLLLDDLEMGLHPAAQGQLIEALRGVMAADPELQIVATSHSPFILNFLKPEEVRLTYLTPDGSARCGKLTDHPDYARWKDVMKPGELWSTLGESWLAGPGTNGHA